MIFTLTIECVSGLYLEERCIRIVEIDEQASLYDLHQAIQDTMGFDRDHPYEFFLTNSPSPFARKTRLINAEMWDDKEEDYLNIRLCDVYPLDHKRGIPGTGDSGDTIPISLDARSP